MNEISRRLLFKKKICWHAIKKRLCGSHYYYINKRWMTRLVVAQPSPGANEDVTNGLCILSMIYIIYYKYLDGVCV